MTAKTTTKISKTKLAAGFREVLKANGLDEKNRVSVTVVHGDGFTIGTFDTQWGGGSRNVYNCHTIGTDSLNRCEAVEGGKLAIPAGCAIVIESVFCGKMFEPSVYVHNADLPAFFGIETPAELKGMDAAVVADWIEENADHFGPRVGKKRREAAELIRQLCAR